MKKTLISILILLSFYSLPTFAQNRIYFHNTTDIPVMIRNSQYTLVSTVAPHSTTALPYIKLMSNQCVINCVVTQAIIGYYITLGTANVTPDNTETLFIRISDYKNDDYSSYTSIESYNTPSGYYSHPVGSPNGGGDVKANGQMYWMTWGFGRGCGGENQVCEDGDFWLNILLAS